MGIDDSIMSKSEDSLVTKPAADVAPQTQGNTHSKDASLDCEDSTLGTDTSEVDESVTVRQVKTITTKQKKTKKQIVQRPDSEEQVTDEKIEEGPVERESFTTSYVGKLKLNVRQGKDLEKKDVVQKADPYVFVKFGSQESKSKKVKNTLNPVWNHEVILDLEGTSPREVEFQLMDWERFGKDEPMGRVVLPLETLVREDYQGGVWVDLQSCKSGQILVSTEFSGSIARELVGGGVRELRNLLEQKKVEEPVVEENPDEGSTLVTKVTKTTTKRTRVVRRVMIGPDGKELVTEEVVEEPEGLQMADDTIKNTSEAETMSQDHKNISEEEAGAQDDTEDHVAVAEQKEERKEESWRSIPIIRLDQNQLEITEMSDEEQDEPMDLTLKPGLMIEPMVTTPSDEEPMDLTSKQGASEPGQVEEIGEIVEVIEEPTMSGHKPLSNNSSVSSVSSSLSAVTVIEVQRSDSDQESWIPVKNKPPTGISKPRGTSRQNSGQETPPGSRLVMAEAAQHKDALRKKSESSGDESEKEKDKSRWSVNIPITRVETEDEVDQKRWSVNIPIIRNEPQAESKVPGIAESVEEATPEKETSAPPTQSGQLKVIVHQGKDLEKKDVLQKADPYLLISLGSKQSKSEKVKNTLNPSWNHEVTFEIDQSTADDIEVQLMDWERVGKDEPMGKACLPIAEAVSKSAQEKFWINLEECKSGKILVSTVFTESQEPSTASAEEPKIIPGESSTKAISTDDETKSLIPPKQSDSSPSPKNKRVEGGMTKGGLVSRDKRKIPTETTPPQEERKIPISVEKTAVQVQEEKLDTGVKDNKEKTLTSPGEKSVPITIEKTTEKKEKELEEELEITTSEEKSISINVEREKKKSESGAKGLKKLLTEEKKEAPADVDKTAKSPKSTKKISKSETPLLGTLYLKVKKATNLDSKEAIGKSDPYVIIKYGETKLVSPAKSNTNNPEWDFEVDFKVHQNHPESIQIEIMDQDRLGADDSLGSLAIDTNSVLKWASEKTFVSKLSDSKDGQVEYSVKFSPVDSTELKPHTVETSHVFNIPGGGGSLKDTLEVSHSIQLPEGFEVESIDSTQTETHTFVKTDLGEEAGVHEVITLDKDSQESKIQRDIVIDSLEDTSSQPKPAEKKTSLVIPFMKKET